MERLGPLPHGLVQELLLALDVRIERAFLNSQGRREVADRGAVVALLGEEARGVTRELLAARGANLPSLTSVR